MHMDGIKPKVSPEDALFQQKVEALKRSAKDPEKLKKAAEDFEALFVNYMLKSMRKTVMKSDLMGTGLGGDIMQSMFDEKLSGSVAQGSSLGIAELLYNQFSDQNGAGVAEQFSLKALPLRRAAAATPQQAVKNYTSHNPLQARLKPFDSHVRLAARNHGLAPNLIRAVIAAESGGNPRAQSSKNAKGLMQLMDSTAAEVGVRDSFNPGENIDGGSRYLANLLKRFGGDTKMALAAYNAGPTAVEKYNGIPPYRETRNYVQKVLRYFREFEGSGKEQNKKAVDKTAL